MGMLAGLICFNLYFLNELDDDLTVIKTKVNIDNHESTLAIVGPKRMEYDKVVSKLSNSSKEQNLPIILRIEYFNLTDNLSLSK